VYDLVKKAMLKTIKSGKELILDLTFHDKEQELMTIGVKHQVLHQIHTADKPSVLQNA
jgi:hypothetical protein